MIVRTLFLALLIIPLIGCNAAVIEPACQPSDQQICGIQRPEDLEQIPQSRWMLISEVINHAKPGRILALDPVNGEIQIVVENGVAISESSSFPSCGEPPKEIRPRGFHLSRDLEGELRLLLISSGRVERFHIRQSTKDIVASWDGCVTIPEGILANDVAGFADGGFVISHMFDLPRTKWTDFRFFFGLDTGYAMVWRPSGGWDRLANTDASFANGIQIDPKTSRVYVSSMFTQTIIAVDRDGTNPSESSRLPSQVDNLSWTGDGRLIGVGHTGIPVYGVSPCRNIGDKSCSFPFTVVSLNPKTLEHQVLFRASTGAIPGASVAIIRENDIYLGTAYGDWITRIPFETKD